METIEQRLSNLADFESINVVVNDELINLKPIPYVGIFITYNNILYFEESDVIKKSTWEEYLQVFLSSPLYRDTLRVKYHK
jgi:hypothetical protein